MPMLLDIQAAVAHPVCASERTVETPLPDSPCSFAGGEDIAAWAESENVSVKSRERRRANDGVSKRLR